MKKLEKETRQKAHGTGRKVNEPADLSILMASQKVGKSLFPSFRLNETCPGENREPESSVFSLLRILWTPVFTGVTASYETVNFDKERGRCYEGGGREGCIHVFESGPGSVVSGEPTTKELIIEHLSLFFNSKPNDPCSMSNIECPMINGK
jgi:hypothetical protein